MFVGGPVFALVQIKFLTLQFGEGITERWATLPPYHSPLSALLSSWPNPQGKPSNWPVCLCSNQQRNLLG